MKAFCILVSLFAVFAGKRITNRWCNLLTAMGLLHTVTVFFASLRLFDYYEANDAIYLMIALGIVAFSFAYYMALSLRTNRGAGEAIHSYDISDRYQLRYPLFVICVCVLVFFSLLRFAGFISLITSGIGFGEIREYYYNPQLAEKALGSMFFSKNALVTYFYLPCLFLLMIIATVSLFHNIIGKRRKLYIVIIYVCVGIYCLTSGGGRNIIYSIGCMAVFACLYSNKQDMAATEDSVRYERKQRQKKRGRIMILTLAAAVCLVLGFSLARTNSGTSKSFFETLYQYYCGYIPYSSHFYENLKQEDFFGGWMFISCLTKPFTNLANSLLSIDFSDVYSRACVLLEQFSEHVRISPFQRTNAYVSVFYCFYTDFGYASVFLESLIFGACCGVSDGSSIYRPNYRSLVFNLFWFYIALWSAIRWYFLSVHVMLAFYLALVLFKKRSVNCQDSISVINDEAHC